MKINVFIAGIIFGAMMVYYFTIIQINKFEIFRDLNLGIFALIGIIINLKCKE